MSKVKQVKVALLALVAALVIAIPTSAFAAGTYTVTINNDKTGHTYGAYQVFTGDLSGDTLSNITWGKDIDATTAIGGQTLIGAIQAINLGTDEAPNRPFAGKTTAAQVAEVLATEAFGDGTSSAYNSTDIFAATIAPYLTSDLAEAQKQSNCVENKYIISNLAAGYYLIRDVNTVTGQDAATKFILQVVKDQSVSPKSSVPTSDKGIDEDDDKSGDAYVEQYGRYGDYTIGQTIPYQLSGTLPDTYANYASYYYVFHDKYSAGLTVDLKSVKVYYSTDNGATKTEVGSTLYSVAAETPINTEDEKYLNGFKVEIDDLKQIVNTYSAETRIYVKYNATLNSNAVIGNTGNPNKSYLEFNNDSNNAGKGKPTGNTPDDYAIAFTYELDSTKKGVDTDADGLDGAKFILYRDYNAAVDDKALTGEIATDAKMYAVVGTDGKITSWTSSKDGATKLESKTVDGSKGRFDVIGLDQGKYYLEETDAPATYNKLAAPIEFVITATHEKLTSGTVTDMEQIKTLQIKVGNGTAQEGNTDTGVVTQDIANTKGSVLPSTGGIGTTIFYVVGGALVLVALVATVLRRRRSATTA